MNLRLIAYAPNGARRGPLPTPEGITAAMVFGDVGALDVTYPTAGPKVAYLQSAAEVAVEVSYDEGKTWSEPENARFPLLNRESDPLDEVPVLKYAGPGYVWLLTKARVLPEGKLDAEGKRAFLSKNPGAILSTLFQEAKARGGMAGFDVSTFNALTDSAGQAWPEVITLKYEPGLDYLTILANLHEQGMVDFTMVGRQLRVYVADTVMAGASGVTLKRGRDLSEAPYKGTLAGLANFVYLLGDEGKSFSRTGAGIAPWGRWEDFLTQGGVSDTGTMTVLTDAALALAAEERVEETYGLVFARAKSYPFRDYGLGKSVGVHVAGQPVQRRLRQITLTRDAKGVVAGNVVLNDRFLEDEIRRSRRTKGITGGASADGGSGGRPAPVNAVDRVAPKAPTSLSYATDAYLDNAGKVWALVTLSWVPPTENVDGTALADLAGYQVYYRPTGTGGTGAFWSRMVPTTGPQANISGLAANTHYEFSLRAVDESGNLSPYSAIYAVVTDDDVVAPPKPSTPTALAYLGQIMLAWNGLSNTGAAMPSDFARVEFQISTDPAFATFTVVDQSTARGPVSTVATGLAYGTTYYARVRAYDHSGNASVPSNSASAVPVKMGGVDLAAGIVGYDAFAFKQNGNSIPDGTLEDADFRAALAKPGTMAAGWSLLSDAANSVSGLWSLKADGAVGSGQQRAVQLLADKGVSVPGQTRGNAMRVSPGERWLFRCMAKGTTNDTIRVVWWVYDGAGQFINWVIPSPYYTGGALGTYSVALTMPNKAAYAAPTLVMDTAVSSGVSYFDDLEIRPIIGTALIEDAAITNAKVASMAVDKLSAGVMNALVTISGRLATSLTGARTELNSTGLVSYDASGNLRTYIPSNGGDNLLTGTVKTGLTGARVEIAAAGASGGVARFYSAHASETSPGTVSTWVQGNAPAANAALYLVSPKRNAYTQCTMVLQSSDADGAASAALYVDRGDLQIVSTTTNGFVWGGINLRNSDGTVWAQLMRDGGWGAKLHAQLGSVRVSSAFNANLSAGESLGLEAFNGTIHLTAKATQHQGGPLRLKDTWARGISSAAAVGIGSDGTLYHITSSARYKLDIQDAELDPAAMAKGLRPRTFIDRREHEENDGSTEGLKRHLGLIAEEVATIPVLGDLIVPRDEQGRPNEVRYDRVALALIPWLHAMEDRLERLESGDANLHAATRRP